MECHIARVTQVAPYVNAIIADRFDEALAEAKQLDKELDESPNDERFSEGNKPFLGVPLSVKEAFAVTGELVIIYWLLIREGIGINISNIFLHENLGCGNPLEAPHNISVVVTH